MPDPFAAISSFMARQGSLALAMAATALAIGGAPLSARSSASSASADGVDRLEVQSALSV